MAGMARYPDKYFDLAVVDPPYGIGINPNMGLKKGQRKRHDKVEWDNEPPDDTYFNELFRVSKNQIIWGGNYFYLPPTYHFIFWDKLTPDGLSFSDGEYAWTSYNMANRKYVMRNVYDGKIHPTQKPVRLYEWLYMKYLPEGGKVIDTHLGSGSNRIAAHKMGNIDFIGYEIDKEYFDASEKRYKYFTSQTTLF